MNIIEGNRLLLRQITEGDTESILRWRNSEHVRRNFIHQEPITISEHEQWIRDKLLSGQAIQFIMIVKETQQPIGSVYLRDIDRKVLSAEYGIFIGETDALGCGYGSEAIRLMENYAFVEMGLKHISLRVLEHNSPAIHIYEKAGFRRSGRIEVAQINGQTESVLFYQKNVLEE